MLIILRYRTKHAHFPFGVGYSSLAVYTWAMLAYLCLERIATGRASEVHHSRMLLNKNDLLSGQFLIFLPKKIKKIVNYLGRIEFLNTPLHQNMCLYLKC